jgi:hypothetical protein
VSIGAIAAKWVQCRLDFQQGGVGLEVELCVGKGGQWPASRKKTNIYVIQIPLPFPSSKLKYRSKTGAAIQKILNCGPACPDADSL